MRLFYFSFFFALIYVAPSEVFSQGQTSAKSDSTQNKKGSLFELSFGQNVSFISAARQDSIRTKNNIVVPPNAILFFVELRPAKKLRVPFFLNLQAKREEFVLKNIMGADSTIRLSPSISYGTGLEYKLLSIPISKKSKVEFESGLLASFVVNKKQQLICGPVAAGRVRFLKNDDFVIYVGYNYALGINTWGLFYGTGYIF